MLHTQGNTTPSSRSSSGSTLGSYACRSTFPETNWAVQVPHCPFEQSVRRLRPAAVADSTRLWPHGTWRRRETPSEKSSVTGMVVVKMDLAMVVMDDGRFIVRHADCESIVWTIFE
ncbi:hypothetical protein D9M72_571570 [compost metagenome]